MIKQILIPALVLVSACTRTENKEQTYPGDLYVHVDVIHNAKNIQLPGIQVSATSALHTYTGITDSKGCCVLKSLPRDVYNISAYHENYDTVTTFGYFHPGGAVSDMSVYLQDKNVYEFTSSHADSIKNRLLYVSFTHTAADSVLALSMLGYSVFIDTLAGVSYNNYICYTAGWIEKEQESLRIYIDERIRMGTTCYIRVYPNSDPFNYALDPVHKTTEYFYLQKSKGTNELSFILK